MSSSVQEVAHPYTSGSTSDAPKDDKEKAICEILSQWLPSQGPDHDYWWRLTGPHLALALEEAGYSSARQYEILLFHYYWAAAYLGQKPQTDGSLTRKSLLNVNGTPIEYSWKWNSTPTNLPQVRYTMEPINQFSRTALDPLNQAPALELLHRLATVLPETDLTWANHFFSSCFDHDRSKYMQEVESGAPQVTTILVSFELPRKGLSTKTYFLPRKLGQTSVLPRAEWESAIRSLVPDTPNPSLDALSAFLETSPEGQTLQPGLLAVDNINPSSSRLKYYLGTPRTSFSSVREILTLGRCISGPETESRLNALRDLLTSITPLNPDHPDDAEIPTAEGKEDFKDPASGGLFYHFDVAPGPQHQLPEIKLYVCVRNFKLDDLTIAKGLTGWMERQGRGAYCENYMRVLRGIAGDRPLGESYGIQSFVSCIFKKEGLLDVTSYLSPEIQGA